MNEKLCMGLGELLFDVLPSGSQLGGTPANFVYHAGQHGLRSVAVSAVGNDMLGDEAIRLLDEKNLRHVAPVVAYPTGTVHIELAVQVSAYVCTQRGAMPELPESLRLK